MQCSRAYHFVMAYVCCTLPFEIPPNEMHGLVLTRVGMGQSIIICPITSGGRTGGPQTKK